MERRCGFAQEHNMMNPASSLNFEVSEARLGTFLWVSFPGGKNMNKYLNVFTSFFASPIEARTLRNPTTDLTSTSAALMKNDVFT